MKTGNTLAKFFFCLLILVGIDYIPVYAQKAKTKVTIIKETYDENGNKSVQTIVKEGAEADAIDLDRLLEGEGQESPSLQWQHPFRMDTLPFGGQFFNYRFDGDPTDLKSLFDSLGLGNFDFFNQEDFPFFDDREFDFNFEANKPRLGIRISEIESQAGVVVNEVMPDTPAEKAGLKEGDIIVTIGDNKVEKPEDVINYVQSLELDDEVKLDILRDGDYHEIIARLSEMKPKKEMEIRKI